MKFSFIKNMNSNTILVAIAIIGIVITGVLIFANSNKDLSIKDWTFGLFGDSAKQIGQKAVDYINNKGLSVSAVSLEEAVEESGLIKIKIKVGGNSFDSYVTKDGKLLFANPPIVMTDGANGDSQNTGPTEEQKKQAAESVKKTDSPLLEAFVVARCPFGLQMQRAMAEAIKEQPSLAQYMRAVYIGDVSSDGKTIIAMHGDAEAKENLRQICIREEQSAKYWPYVACQMKASGTETSCEKSTGVNSSTLNACVSSPSRGVAYAKKDFDLNTKYNNTIGDVEGCKTDPRKCAVAGSPALILNESLVDETNFGGRSSDGIKSMICAGFNSQAGFCSTKLNTAEAAVSFSADYAGAGSNAGNSGNNGANCAPAQ